MPQMRYPSPCELENEALSLLLRHEAQRLLRRAVAVAIDLVTGLGSRAGGFGVRRDCPEPASSAVTGAGKRGPSGGKDNPCWYHFKSAKGCVKGNECTFSHSKKTEHKLESMPKGKGKGKSKSRSSSPKRDDGACFAFQKGKCDRGSACKYRHELIKNNSAPATSSDKAQAKSKAAAKAAAPAIARRVIAVPAIVLKQSAPAGKVSF